MGSPSTRAGAVLVVALLGVLLVATASGGAQVGPGAGTPTPASNETIVRHQDPDRLSGDTAYGDYATYLAGRLSGRLGEGVVEVRRSDYEAARLLVGEEYNETYRQYGEVVALTDDERDDDVAERIAETVAVQRSFINAAATVNDTLVRYREAKRTGDDERARALAHDLDEQVERVESDGAQLQDHYRDFADVESVDLEDRAGTVAATVAEIRAAVEAVTGSEFVETRVTIEESTTGISFLDPLRASGRVAAENGSGVPGATVRIVVEEREYTTTADEDGTFQIAYRPTLLPADARSVTIEYVPTPTDRYRAAEATVPVAVSPVAVEPTVETTRPTVRFNDTLVVRGAVGAGGVGAPAVPVVVAVGREQVARVRTNETGRYRVETRVGSGLASGERPVSVSVPLDGSALLAANASTTVRVAATSTTLRVSGTQVDAREVAVSGRLTTANGTPVPGQSVEVVLDDRSVGRFATDRSGRFSGNVTAPRSALPSRPGAVAEPTLAARYDGTGTSLANASATAGVPMAASVGQFVQVNWDRLLLVGGFLGLLFVGRLWYDRSRDGADDEPVWVRESPASGGAGAAAGGASLLAGARSSFYTGRTDDAIELAYAAVRRYLVDDLGVSGRGTHWEFYRACRDATGNDDERFARLTALYERAAFDDRSVEPRTADEAIQWATSVVEG